VTTTSAAPSPSATGSGTATSSTSNCPVPGNKPAGGVAVVSAIVNGDQVTTQRETWEVDVNTPVRVAVIADTRDEVHVHTYDVKQATVPGCPTMLDFVANIPGTHEVELEGKHLLLFRIKVG
jgi:heme/copper-type cytochrome/quinol oxidase subunit 2